ncbi:PspA/IM30 family protein [Desulfoscipio geothermicus]|uniref:Phage shock protein A (PspA) family protein n=1 Tax=Desulfoscipio geothermicus DSM 3669 TaxID=1121426 RepID=A0A1I6DUW8_9FIRM|nr:PspA/IM30 family protein [Desulfoscipio geothermicus]SFR09226.1 phage shock protein A (PspA) family protein [Desulfoscipio geothermicus DSM 3669]
MSTSSKLSNFFKMRFSKIMDRLEDPMETLEYSFKKQSDLLILIKRSIVSVLTSKKRLEIQIYRLNVSVKEFEQKAHRLVELGKEDLAESLLLRKHELLGQIEEIKLKIEELDAEKEQLIATEAKLTNNLEFLRAQKEIIKAQYAAAKTQVKIDEAVTGLSKDFTDIGTAMERVKEKTLELKAKTTAIEELVEINIFADKVNEDKADRELLKAEIAFKAKDELKKLKESL